jgi:hypothetical protein
MTQKKRGVEIEILKGNMRRVSNKRKPQLFVFFLHCADRVLKAGSTSECSLKKQMKEVSEKCGSKAFVLWLISEKLRVPFSWDAYNSL